MNNVLMWVLIGGAAVAVAAVAKKAYGLSQLNFQIAKVSPRLDGLKFYLDIDVQVQNPTSSTATVNAFVVDLIYNGQVLANAFNPTPVTIQEYGTSKIVFPFKLSAISAATQLMNIVQGASAGSAKITLKGTITVNHIPLPVTITSNIA